MIEAIEAPITNNTEIGKLFYYTIASRFDSHPVLMAYADVVLEDRLITPKRPKRTIDASWQEPLTIETFGWTREEAAEIRGIFGSIAEDWDDPEMDIYDEYYGSQAW